MKRRVESLSQTGEARERCSGSTVLPEGESLKGQEHGGEAASGEHARTNAPKTRAIGSRMDCLNQPPAMDKQIPRDARKGAVGRIGRFHFRRRDSPAERRRTRPFKGANRNLRRAITFDSHGHGMAFGGEAHGDGAVVVVTGREVE